MIIIDAVVDWLQQNSAGMVVGLGLVILFLIVVARYVEIENNKPGQ
jgi:hypothetical protein